MTCLKGVQFMKNKTWLFSLGISLISFNLWAQNAPEPEIYPYRITSVDQNEMQVINTGVAALYARIDMIRRASTSLDMEYFIFNPDSTGRIIVKELINAAKRGVKVRVLIDKSSAVFKLDEFYAEVFKENNIELRYYNPAIFLQISSVQFRNHRKLIVRDGVEAITGGRNIADEYFNLSTTFNFLDREVWVEGEVVKAMKDSFELYWKSDIVQIPKDIKAPIRSYEFNSDNQFSEENNYQRQINLYNKKVKEAHLLVDINKEDDKTLEYVMDYGKKALGTTNKYACPIASFATDREGASFLERIHSKDYNQNYRILRKEIAKWMDKIQDEIILDSPYFLEDKNSREIMTNLMKNNTKITILTNSLASTDAVYVSTVFNDSVKDYTANDNFNAYIYRGSFSNESELMNDTIRNSSWGTHSKTIVYNNNSFMVGTFNIDNRSNFYNTEMAIFCSGSPELTNDIISNIKTRISNSRHLNKNGLPDDGTDILEGTSLKKKILYFMLKIPASIGQFLM